MAHLLVELVAPLQLGVERQFPVGSDAYAFPERFLELLDAPFALGALVLTLANDFPPRLVQLGRQSINRLAQVAYHIFQLSNVLYLCAPRSQRNQVTEQKNEPRLANETSDTYRN